MKSFKQFLSEASIRQGLPHITTMDHNQLMALTKGGKVHLHDMTEKTDGQTHMMGYDEHGFYTQSSGSGSDKMRAPEDYHERVTRRAKETGKTPDYSAANAFGHIHSILQSNNKLQSHLRTQFHKTGSEVKVRGESFYKPWGKPSEHPGEVKFVGTSYDPSHMGKVGKYVIHSRLPENRNHDIEHFKKNLSDEHINFDDDKLEHTRGHVDVSEEHNKLKSLNHDLLNSKTTASNKESKQQEKQKVSEIASQISSKVDKHVKSLGLRPRWGTGSEGIVAHPTEHNPDAPRFKVTSDAFRSYRASDESKNFKKVSMKGSE